MRRKLFGLGGLKWIAVAAIVVIASLGALQAANQPAVPPALPLGVSRVMYELSVPADRWPTPEKVALGGAAESMDRPVSCRAHHLPTGPGVRAAAKCLSTCGLPPAQRWEGRLDGSRAAMS